MPTAFSCLFTEPDFKTVTCFLGNLSDVKQRLRITRKFKGSMELVVTIGKPNYAEREFLAQCKRASCNPRRFLFKSFPVKKR
jgi:hypothetical protein